MAGTAGAVTGAMRRHQENGSSEATEAARYEQQQAPPAAQAAPPAPGDDLIDQLERLGTLKEQGILTDAEFAAQKARLLAL
ncbi:SHOCT domain-containing protein [Aeromicrobium sp. UC242_57]|uniref:SHOCT domain-containing protein n=1 Tax=Aeromicrobium sp. UC242_57 TaxID=3374624 RepID=UPI0037B51308